MAVFEEAISSLSKENYVEELERIWNKIGESHNRRKISRQSFEVSWTAIWYFFQLKFVLVLFEFATSSGCLISH